MAPHKLDIRYHGGIFDITVGIFHDRKNILIAVFNFMKLWSVPCLIIRKIVMMMVPEMIMHRR